MGFVLAWYCVVGVLGVRVDNRTVFVLSPSPHTVEPVMPDLRQLVLYLAFLRHFTGSSTSAKRRTAPPTFAGEGHGAGAMAL